MKTKVKKSGTKIILSLLLAVAVIFKVSAQTDTTKLEFGKKKIVIIDGKTHKQQAINNLEKGKQSFIEEIEKSKKEIEEMQKKIEELQAKNDSTENENIEREIMIQEKLIEANEHKIEAFEKGIADIEEGIADIEEDLGKIQHIEKSHDTIIIIGDEDDKEIHVNKKNDFNGHWAGFSMGIANFLTNNYAIAKAPNTSFMNLVPEKSLTYSLNIFEYNIPLLKSYTGFVTGAGMEWNSYALSQNVDLYVENSTLHAVYVDPAVRDYEKNKFNMVYATVPLMLEFQIPLGKERIYIAGGATGSIRLWSKQKQKYFSDDIKMKDKVTDGFNLTPFRYGATLRIGYGDFGIFADYKFTPLFKTGQLPELYPFTLGISIINF